MGTVLVLHDPRANGLAEAMAIRIKLGREVWPGTKTQVPKSASVNPRRPPLLVDEVGGTLSANQSLV